MRKGGKCQENSIRCDNYFSGLCNGGRTRQCCVTNSGSVFFGFILILFTTFTYTLLKMCTYNAVFIIKVTTTYTAYINLNKSFVSSTVADRPCVAKGGKCQQNTLTCSGDYERGLCGGSSARQCCVPRSGKAIPPL